MVHVIHFGIAYFSAPISLPGCRRGRHRPRLPSLSVAGLRGRPARHTRLDPIRRARISHLLLISLRCGLALAKNPAKFFSECRQAVGDSFIVYAFGLKLLCTFSRTGLRSLYTVREADASFTEATRGLLGLKLPPEVLPFSRSFSFSNLMLLSPRVLFLLTPAADC